MLLHAREELVIDVAINPSSAITASARWREPDSNPRSPRESNGEKAKEPVSLVERKMPEMSSTGRRLSIFTSGFSRD